jgi:hypothetical protein
LVNSRCPLVYSPTAALKKLGRYQPHHVERFPKNVRQGLFNLPHSYFSASMELLRPTNPLLMQSEEESRHPLFLSYGTILPNSLALVLLPRLGLLCQGHLYWFSVRSYEIKRAFFSWAVGLTPTPCGTIPDFADCSSQRDFVRMVPLNRMYRLELSPRVERAPCVAAFIRTVRDY